MNFHAHYLAPLLADKSAQSAVQIWMWLGIILVLGVLLILIAAKIRKKVLEQDSDDTPILGFTLRDLRQMHAQGQISDEELQRAEERTLARSRETFLGEDATSGNDADEAHAQADSDAGSFHIEPADSDDSADVDDDADQADEDGPENTH